MKNIVIFLSFAGMVFFILILSSAVSSISYRLNKPDVEQSAPVVAIEEPQTVVPKKVSKKISTKEKKANFYTLVLPEIKKVHDELMQRYLDVEEDLKSGKNKNNIVELKKRYGVKTDEALLLAIKPHPQSIVLAQAVLESSWGTSRLFVEANNIFGMKSHRSNEPRISASKNESGGPWFKKFETLEESVRAYYRIIGKRKEYAEFRAIRFVSKDPFEMIEKLTKYAEIGEKYPKELAKLMRHNKLVEHDE